MSRLAGKVAIVTGGGSGIGRGIVLTMARQGADIAIPDIQVLNADKVAEEVKALGRKVLAMKCDVTSSADVKTMVDRTRDQLGRIDILVNNAGTSWGAAAEDVPLAAWQKVIDVNLTGAFLFAQAVGRELIRQGDGGKIINIASVAAFRGAAPEELDAVPYSVSKGGLVALTTDLAVKWARHRICVNAIAPGWFPSDMSAVVLERAGQALLAGIPLGRFGGGHDLKGAAAFLASPASDFVSGVTLPVDGGQLAC
jgi:NAD(P)-dependent dehydrogenase (short-subunit alcohol dehydrogenase family)